ncbi:phage tail protein [Providencia rettgeri]
MDKLPKFTLPVWMDKGEVKKLRDATHRFWTGVYSWLLWPLKQIDPLTCDERLLDAIAWQRDVTRFTDEPLELYRKRVNYAFVNAKDAGSVTGFVEIFKRLGIGYIEINERQPDIDWDVIILRVTDEQLANNHNLLMNIIRQYGRTCRRYQYEVLQKLTLNMRVGHISGEYICYAATMPNDPFFMYVGQIESDSVCHSATLKTGSQTYSASLM